MREQRRFKFGGACALFAAAAASVPAGAQTLSSFTATYNGGETSSCSTTYNILGKEPAATGTYPVFVYTVGTGASYNSSGATLTVDEMAARGYVAATVEYKNKSFSSCSVVTGRARCIFDSGNANSAIRKLCSRAKADCSKGIVVAGVSQGAVMGTLAKNYESRVEAAYGLGLGVQYATTDLRSCIASGKRSLPDDRLRAINGEADQFMGGSESTVRGQLQELTGLACGSNATSCFRGSGSGWYIVQHAEVEDMVADHCYMVNGGCVLGSGFDEGWQIGSAPWSLKPNLDWLTNFTQ